MFMLLFAFSRSRAGHTIIYYWSWLLVVLLIVTHSDKLNSLMSGGKF